MVFLVMHRTGTHEFQLDSCLVLREKNDVNREPNDTRTDIQATRYTWTPGPPLSVKAVRKPPERRGSAAREVPTHSSTSHHGKVGSELPSKVFVTGLRLQHGYGPRRVLDFMPCNALLQHSYQ